MKSDFLLAIGALAAEKNLPKDVVLEAVEAALTSAYRRDGENAPNVYVKVDSETGDIRAYMQKSVVEEVEEPNLEIALAEAARYKRDAKAGDVLDFEMPLPENAGRIAAQTAKQVVLQRLREAERDAVYDEYSGKEGEILVGTIQRVEPRQMIVELGKGTEAVLPSMEQVRNEHLRAGQRVKVIVLEVQKAVKGPQVIVSRAHRSLLRRLLEMEVPEILAGTVEVKSIAREGGHRSKVAVHARNANVDPIGACVGPRGSRIQNIVNELGGERVDIVKWDPDPGNFVGNALSPAEVIEVTIDEMEHRATVTVPDKMLSLAIGKEGQNARLAAKLTGWRIDIHSQSAAERGEEGLAEAASTFEPFMPGEEPDIDIITVEEEPVVLAPAATLAPEVAEGDAATEEGDEAAAEPEVLEPAAALADEEDEDEDEAGDDDEEEYEVPTVVVPENRPAAIRFAEDVLPRREVEADDPAKRAAAKKVKRAPRFVEDVEEDLEEIDYSGRIH
ncbi:MAG TPA: transcription termination factor NusA [Tepidiformaceae bacterium]|nr:transcription termination factor NusA [Tepidiformaceae bacterium]